MRGHSLISLCGLAVALGSCGPFGEMADPTDPPFPMTGQQISTLMHANQIYVRSINGDGTWSIDCRCGPQVKSNEISPWVAKALIATEDIRFYAHKGFDPISTTRALTKNVLGFRKAEGGSTLEMQLCKNKVLNKDKGFNRKWQERSCAKAVAQAMSKADTLLAYLNSSYFGEGRGHQPSYGIEQAALTIFSKHASKLGVYGSALLIGMLQAPGKFNPYKDWKKADARAKVVLAQMYKYQFISRREYATAKQGRVQKGNVQRLAFGHRYFTDWIMKTVATEIPQLAAGMHIPLTLQVRTQSGGEAGFAKALKAAAMPDQQFAAFASIRSDGQVIAMMGGQAYAQSQFNNFVEGQRPPASTFKAIVYAAGIEKGMNIDQAVFDGARKGEIWKASLLETAKGQISVSEAFARSRNIPAIRIAEVVGYKKLVQLAKRMGIAGNLLPNQNLALGGFNTTPLNMTSAFTTFTNAGFHQKPYGHFGIVAADGKILSWPDRVGVKVLKPSTVKTMQALMRKVVTRGTGKPADAVKDAKGKTGTSDNNRDGWFIGFTEKTVTGVWIGDTNSGSGVTANGALAAQL